MLRPLLLPLVLLASSALAHAQIIAVHFNDEKQAKKFKDNLTYVNGEPVLVGEARTGIVYDAEKGTLTFDDKGRNEIFVSDPSDPTKVPYKFDKSGEKVAKQGKYVVGIDGPKIRRLSLLIREDTLAGLAREYLFRVDQLEELIAKRDELAKGGEAWFAASARVVTHYERLQSWLDRTAFPDAAKKLEREIEKERKVVQAGGARKRIEAAKASIKSVTTPQSLLEASKALTDGRLRFKVQESTHIRITYLDRLSDPQIHDLLEFGESVIEGYRNDFVDPYRTEDFGERIPDEIFHEFWFGPDDLKLHELFRVQHYGLGWDEKHKQALLDSSGVSSEGVRGLARLNYTKLFDGTDLEASLAHNLGHSLARLHYGNNQDIPDWLAEASAYYCSFEYLGRNGVTCTEFRDLKYLQPKGAEGAEKTIETSMREHFNELAIAQGTTITQLALKHLIELEDADIAKSWSVFDYVARKESENGQLWLRAECAAAADEKAAIPKWRELSEQIFGVQGQDVFKLIEERWRAFAEHGQDKSGNARGR